MKPIYLSNYIFEKTSTLNHLLNDLEWLQVTEARKEYFMSEKTLEYTYGVGDFARTYTSKPYSEQINNIQNKLNYDYSCNYNVCFLNRYDTQKHQLGWHADDSKEMNFEHPIAVVSFGAEREIWWKKSDQTGLVPKEQRQLLGNGSLFTMPAGFQKDHLHRIPKCDRSCGIRISLTFRNYLEIK